MKGTKNSLDHTTNEQVFHHSNQERADLRVVNRKYFLSQLIMKSKTEGNAELEEKKLSCIRNIRNCTGSNYEENLSETTETSDDTTIGEAAV